MKKFMYNKLKSIMKFVDVEHKIGDKICDVFAIDFKGRKIAIECQNSTVSEDYAMEKLSYYTQRGYYSLWILSTKNYYTKYCRENDFIIRSKSIERFLHKNYFGRIYYYDFKKDNLFASHMCSYYRYVNNEYGEGYLKYYKTIRNTLIIYIQRFGMLCTKSNEFLIARFWDKKWW